MTDRELLELAAKACDYPLQHSRWDEHLCGYHTGSHFWSPLTDDGDALRLAVKLQLTVCNEHVSAGAAYCTRGDDDYPEVRSGEHEGVVIADDYTATRRAIVHAAAEIGRLS